MERIKDGETVLMAEGYLFELERRGYLQAGTFVSEVVLEHPEVVKSVYEEFAHCGSDVVLAFTVRCWLLCSGVLIALSQLCGFRQVHVFVTPVSFKLFM